MKDQRALFSSNRIKRPLGEFFGMLLLFIDLAAHAKTHRRATTTSSRCAAKHRPTPQSFILNSGEATEHIKYVWTEQQRESV